MDEATRICALLLRHGTVPRAEVPQLDHAAVREEVEERLGEVGLVLATSAYSTDVGTRLSPAVTADPGFDAASNLGLKADACALLVILRKAVFPSGPISTDRSNPDQMRGSSPASGTSIGSVYSREGVPWKRSVAPLRLPSAGEGRNQTKSTGTRSFDRRSAKSSRSAVTTVAP